MNLHSLLNSVEGSLPLLASRQNLKAFIGYDGYIDKIQRVVRSKNLQGSDFFPSIGHLAERLGELSGMSGQLELVTSEIKIGGNAPIMAHALASLGVSNWCVGGLDHPIFDQMHGGCERVSIGSPAETNALEFDDGKIILSEVSVFKQWKWSFIRDKAGLDRLWRTYQGSDLIAFVDWANVPFANDLWKGYLNEVVRPQMDMRNTIPLFFFDLADPSKRSAGEIREALDIVAQYQEFGRVFLGMNENEARRIWAVMKVTDPRGTSGEEFPGLQTMAEQIRSSSGINAVLIHPTDRSLLVTDQGVKEIPGRLVRAPKVLTGGGDNFNAGFCLGLLHGLGLESCMILAMATSGAYVEDGQSPDIPALGDYLQRWKMEMT